MNLARLTILSIGCLIGCVAATNGGSVVVLKKPKCKALLRQPKVLSSLVRVDAVGDPSELTDKDYRLLRRTFAQVYNMLTQRECDSLGRFIKRVEVQLYQANPVGRDRRSSTTCQDENLVFLFRVKYLCFGSKAQCKGDARSLFGNVSEFFEERRRALQASHITPKSILPSTTQRELTYTDNMFNRLCTCPRADKGKSVTMMAPPVLVFRDAFRAAIDALIQKGKISSIRRIKNVLEVEIIEECQDLPLRIFEFPINVTVGNTGSAPTEKDVQILEDSILSGYNFFSNANCGDFFFELVDVDIFENGEEPPAPEPEKPDGPKQIFKKFGFKLGSKPSKPAPVPAPAPEPEPAAPEPEPVVEDEPVDQEGPPPEPIPELMTQEREQPQSEPLVGAAPPPDSDSGITGFGGRAIGTCRGCTEEEDPADDGFRRRLQRQRKLTTFSSSHSWSYFYSSSSTTITTPTSLPPNPNDVSEFNTGDTILDVGQNVCFCALGRDDLSPVSLGEAVGNLVELEAMTGNLTNLVELVNFDISEGTQIKPKRKRPRKKNLGW